jgi:hypothetical protein
MSELKYMITYKTFEGQQFEMGNNCIKGTDGNCHIFYHQTDDPNLNFIKGGGGHYDGYIFFSTQPQSFLVREYSYEITLHINKDDIFCIYPKKSIITDQYGKASDVIFNSIYDKHKKEINELLSDNLDYFYEMWIRSGTDAPTDVQYLWNEKNNLDPDYTSDPLELLTWFTTEWNDSWCILETALFINFIESKGYKGFLTIEEGIINIAIKDIDRIEIIKKTTNFT